MATKPKTIDEYLANVPTDKRNALQQVRQQILSAAPGAEECFSYGVPAFRLNGKVIAGLAAAAKHCSYYPMSGRVITSLKKELARFDTTKGAIHFQPDAMLPARLVQRLVKARIAEARN
jgi:uncharacterized protein YdhG (YjbR/CyaY superfamily)